MIIGELNDQLPNIHSTKFSLLCLAATKSALGLVWFETSPGPGRALYFKVYKPVIAPIALLIFRRLLRSVW